MHNSRHMDADYADKQYKMLFVYRNIINKHQLRLRMQFEMNFKNNVM